MKLSQKLFKQFLGIALVSILLTATFSMVVFWHMFSSQETDNLGIYAHTLVKAYNANKHIVVPDINVPSNLRITLIAEDGEVLYDTNEKLKIAEMENHANRPEVSEALENGIGESSRMSELHNSITHYYAIRTDDGNVLRVSTYNTLIFQVFVGIFPYIIIISLFVFICCIPLSKLSTKKVVNPIYEMSESLDNAPYDELTPFTETINKQQKEIKRQIRKLQIEKNKISTLIQNMSEGFILLDMKKNILMCNYSATKLLDLEGKLVEGKNITSFSKSESANDCVESAINGIGKSCDLKIKKKTLQIITNPVYSNDVQNGVICLILDISEKEKAEKMRQEFTANVTHELKTPLTSISGYAEIIASGIAKPDDVQGFANKIRKESARLLALIGDIIELSLLDESKTESQNNPVNLAAIAFEVAEDLKSNAEKQNVSITVDAEESVIKGNRNQLYEVIYNLCDNAIRYNKPDGKVNISVKNIDNRSIVKVSDTGIGIPKKHQKRVFERFYRVDKSRSKDTGGTGLGLAIVKHIVEHHRGELTLESDNNGTTFTIKF